MRFPSLPTLDLQLRPLAAKADGVVLIGADAKVMQAQLMAITKRNIPIVGWRGPCDRC